MTTFLLVTKTCYRHFFKATLSAISFLLIASRRNFLYFTLCWSNYQHLDIKLVFLRMSLFINYSVGKSKSVKYNGRYKKSVYKKSLYKKSVKYTGWYKKSLNKKSVKYTGRYKTSPYEGLKIKSRYIKCRNIKSRYIKSPYIKSRLNIQVGIKSRYIKVCILKIGI